MKNYDTLMQQMTPEQMAELGVKLVTINNRDFYYMTSSGQLYPTSNYEDAVRHEYNWLNYDPDEAAAKSDAENPAEGEVSATDE